MLFNLVKKDFILAKKYWLFLIILAIGIPIFITAKINFKSGGFLGFFIMVIYIEYMLFGTVSMTEDKYKGSALLCTTPYTRKSLVKSKYILILVIFVFAYIIYTIMTFVSPLGIERLNIFTLGMSLLIISILFGAVIPIQCKFGYEKTRYIFFGFIFVSTFLVPIIIKQLTSQNISFKIVLHFPTIIQNLLVFLLALIISFVSMNLSIKIYSKKNL